MATSQLPNDKSYAVLGVKLVFLIALLVSKVESAIYGTMRVDLSHQILIGIAISVGCQQPIFMVQTVLRIQDNVTITAILSFT